MNFGVSLIDGFWENAFYGQTDGYSLFLVVKPVFNRQRGYMYRPILRGRCTALLACRGSNICSTFGSSSVIVNLKPGDIHSL